MGRQYESIQPLSFSLPSSLPWKGWLLQIPESWKAALSTLTNNLNRDRQLPLKDLNAVLQLLIADLFCVVPGAGRSDSRDWLVSEQPINTNIIALIAKAWVKETFTKVTEQEKSTVMNALKGDDIAWIPLELDLAAWQAGPNQTAQTSNGLLWQLLPAFAANQFGDHQIDFGVEGKRDLFRAPADAGIELISWTPFQLRTNAQSYPWSCVITFSVQTIAFDPHPRLYCDFSIRRWVIDPETYFRRDKPTVYLTAQVPWIEGLTSNPHSFQTTKIIRKSGTPPTLHPLDKVSSILTTLDVQRTLPDFNARRFQAMLDEGIAVTFSNRMSPQYHEMGIGFMPKDREFLFEQVSEQLKPYFGVSQQYSRKHREPSNPKVFKAEQDKYRLKNPKTQTASDSHRFRRKRLAEAMGESVVFEVLYQDEATSSVFCQTIAQYFSLPSCDPGMYALPELKITLRLLPLGSLGGQLRLDSRFSKHQQRARQAVDERLDEISTNLGKVDLPTLSFVELQGEEHFDHLGQDTDPKNTLRIGLARSGRHSQFFDADSLAPSEQRALNSLLDGLRQWGIKPPLPMMDGLPPSLFVVGLHVITQNRNTSASGKRQIFPVFVGLEIDPFTENKGIPYARIPGSKDWIRYDQALLQLGSETVTGYGSDEQANDFIKQIIQSLPDLGNTVLLCDAQNARHVWKFLRYGTLTRDRISFNGEQPYPITQLAGLRIALIRSSERHETPQWIVPDGAFTKGIFAITDRVYASTYGMVVTQKTGNFTRFQESNYAHGRKRAWNPAMYEITVAAMQPQDKPDVIAGLVHALRDCAIQFKDATSLPLPLHLAKKMREYLLNVELEEENDNG